MCCSSCLRLVNEAPLNDRPCGIENQVSTWLSQEALVGEMKFHVGIRLEPFLILLVGAEVVENDVKLAVGE